MTHKQFAKLLQTWRAENKYSQRDAAQMLGCSKRSLENWEQQRSMPQGFGLSAMLSLIENPEAGSTSVKPQRTRSQAQKKR